MPKEKALLPRYAERVTCIYIDPSYNTGNEGWVYNDNVNSPGLRKMHDDDHPTIRKEMMAWYRAMPKTDPRKAHKHYNWFDNRDLYFAADFAGPDDGRENRPTYPVLDRTTQLADVDWWVRNVEKKSTSFWLQTASDKFYPDFVVKMKSGIFLAVEYKGDHIADGSDSKEKKRIGEYWARRSGGRCRFGGRK